MNTRSDPDWLLGMVVGVLISRLTTSVCVLRRRHQPRLSRCVCRLREESEGSEGRFAGIRSCLLLTLCMSRGLRLTSCAIVVVCVVVLGNGCRSSRTPPVTPLRLLSMSLMCHAQRLTRCPLGNGPAQPLAGRLRPALFTRAPPLGSLYTA